MNANTATQCNKGINVSWEPVSGATGYKLYRGTASNFAPVDSGLSGANQIGSFTSAPSDIAPYPDNSISPSTTYYYKAVSIRNTETSAVSAPKSQISALSCPDLIVESISPAGPFVEGEAVTFTARIRNQRGATGVAFDNKFLSAFFPFGESSGKPQLVGLLSGEVKETTSSKTWTAPTSINKVQQNYPIEVCADSEFLIFEDDMEGNNCRTQQVIVRPPITANLGCRRQGNSGSFNSTYCVIDFGSNAELKWTTTQTPTSCSAFGDWAGQKTPSPGGLETINLQNISKLLFNYSLKCSR